MDENKTYITPVYHLPALHASLEIFVLGKSLKVTASLHDVGSFTKQYISAPLSLLLQFPEPAASGK